MALWCRLSATARLRASQNPRPDLAASPSGIRHGMDGANTRSARNVLWLVVAGVAAVECAFS